MNFAKSEQEVAQEVIAKLAAEGIEAFVVSRESMGEEFNSVFDDHAGSENVLRVPAWETENKGLSRKAVYEFIHAKLAGQGDKGFVVSLPGVSITDVYCYDPLSVDSGTPLSCADLLTSTNGGTLEQFSWFDLAEGDDSAWWDGWDVPSELEYLPKRLGNLALLMNYQIADLPPVKPFTVDELVGLIKDPLRTRGLFCHSFDLNDRWYLRLSAEGKLVLFKTSDGSETPITAECCNDRGGLVLDGHMLMHRCWGF